MNPILFIVIWLILGLIGAVIMYYVEEEFAVSDIPTAFVLLSMGFITFALAIYEYFTLNKTIIWRKKK